MAQITTNRPLIETRKKIGQYASLGGFAIMIGGVFASFQNQFVIAYGAMFLGLFVANFGTYLLNRWGLAVHEKVGGYLKGLDKHYRLYNYLLPVPNVLLTPFGVMVFLVKNQDGRIVQDDRGWRQPTGLLGSLVRFMRAFSTEPLGDPPKELELQQESMRQFIAEGLEAGPKVPVEGLILFTNPRAEVDLSNPKLPTIALNKQPDGLKNALRKDKRTPRLSDDVYDRLVQLFDAEAEEKTAKSKNEFRFWRR